MQRELQFAQQDAQTEVTDMTNQLQGDFQEKLNPIIEQLRIDKGLLMIFSIRDSGVVAAEPGLDLSSRSDQAVRRESGAEEDSPRRQVSSFRTWFGSGQAAGPNPNLKPTPKLNPEPDTTRHDPSSDQHPDRSTVCVIAIRRRWLTRLRNTSPVGGSSRTRTSPSAKNSSRAISRRAADAGRADDRDARAGRDDPADAPAATARLSRAYLRGVDNAKFRLPVVPGDRLRLEVTMGPRRSRLARAHAVALHRRRASSRKRICCSGW